MPDYGGNRGLFGFSIGHNAGGGTPVACPATAKKSRHGLSTVDFPESFWADYHGRRLETQIERLEASKVAQFDTR